MNTDTIELDEIRRGHVAAMARCLQVRPRARYATTTQIRRTIAASYMDPVPCAQSLHTWFEKAAVPNTGVHQRGLPVYWQVAAAENVLRKRVGLEPI